MAVPDLNDSLLQAIAELETCTGSEPLPAVLSLVDKLRDHVKWFTLGGMSYHGTISAAASVIARRREVPTLTVGDESKAVNGEIKNLLVLGYLSQNAGDVQLAREFCLELHRRICAVQDYDARRERM